MPAWHLLAVLSAAPFCLSCSSAHLTGARSRFNQSCGAGCAAPVNSSTGELLAPTTVRLGMGVERVNQAKEVLQGFITVSRFLDAAEKAAVEKILLECVKEANTKVDEELFGKNRSLPDSECDKEAVVKEKPGTSWAQYLGERKHAAAFDCIQTRLAERFPDNFSVEPRLRKDPFTKEVMLTDWRKGSLKPDLVIHFTRNVTRIQCIYEFKFPCGYEVANPWTSYVDVQMKHYQGLDGQCPPVLVSPQRGLQYNR
ncbi:hypothetical protein [Cystobacter fuscus]|uniref:hypothetical protein n=1 Tax=Cystobacter fuscus TaxID=43 RepID=UPI002B324ECE|nr:hypothetical protein F0U63_23245 [Cystobacter fuscus]